MAGLANVTDFLQIGPGRGAEPAAGSVVEDRGGLGRLEVVSPRTENLLDHPVDFGIQICGVAARRPHAPVQHCIDGETNETNAMRKVVPARGRRQKVVQDLQEVVVVADLGAACRIGPVWPFTRDLGEHGRDEQVDARIGFDQLFEFLQNGVQLMGRVLVNMCDDSAEPFQVRGVARGHPFSDAVLSVHPLGQWRNANAYRCNFGIS